MNGSESIQLTILKNPFKTLDREVLTVSKDYTFAQLYANLGLHYPISYVMFIDGDEIVADIHAKPQSEHIYMKIMPSGNNRQQGAGMKIAGAALIVAGSVLTAYGLGIVGVPLIGMGVGLVLGGVAIYNMNIPKIGAASLDAQGTKYSVNGSENAIRIGGRVPVLLGRHLVVPDVIAAPMVTLDTDGEQKITQAFCGGYGDMRVESGSYRIGDTPLTDDYFTYTLAESYAASYPSELPRWCKTSSVQAELDGTVTDETDPNFNASIVVRSTPGNIYAFSIFLTCPSGIGKYDKNGKLKESAINVKIQYRTNENGTVGSWNNYPNPAYYLYDKPIYDPNWTYPQGQQAPIIGYEPVYTEPNTGIVRISGKTNTTARYFFSLDLANENSIQADYTASRKYDIRVVRASDVDTSTAALTRVYLDFIRYDVAFWSPTKFVYPYKYPTVNGSSVALMIHGLSILAGENANGTVKNFNYVAQTSVNVYSGSGSGASSWTGKALTSNPAALFLYVLRTAYINNHPATEAQIDWAAFETWYAYCNTKDFECNYHASGEFKVSDLFDVIAHAGRASWSIVDAKFTIVIDTTRANVVQAFTPRNARNFSGQKLFIDRPTALRMKFIDETINFQQAERIVYYDDDTPDDTLIQEVSVTGVTNPDQIYKMAKYQLACTYLRPEIFTFDVDAEQLVCLRGDRVKLNHDVPLIGLYSGRISEIFTGSGNDVSILVDEYCIFEPGKTYSVQMRTADVSLLTKALTNPATTVSVESAILTFATPFTSGTISEGNLFMLGESGEESLDLLVMEIEPGNDLSAKLTCVPYSPDVYTADSGTIPDYDPIVSSPADIENTVKLGIPVNAAEEATSASSSIVETDTRSIAMTSTTPAGEVLTLDTDQYLFMPILSESQFEAYDIITDRMDYINDSFACGAVSLTESSAKQFRTITPFDEIDEIAGTYYPIAPGVIYDNVNEKMLFSRNSKTCTLTETAPKCCTYGDDTIFLKKQYDTGVYSIVRCFGEDPLTLHEISGLSGDILEFDASDDNSMIYVLADESGTKYLKSYILTETNTENARTGIYKTDSAMIGQRIYYKSFPVSYSDEIPVVGEYVNSFYFPDNTKITGVTLYTAPNIGLNVDNVSQGSRILPNGSKLYPEDIGLNLETFTGAINITATQITFTGETFPKGYYYMLLSGTASNNRHICMINSSDTPTNTLTVASTATLTAETAASASVQYRKNCIIDYSALTTSFINGPQAGIGNETKIYLSHNITFPNYWASISGSVTVHLPFRVAYGDGYRYFSGYNAMINFFLSTSFLSMATSEKSLQNPDNWIDASGNVIKHYAGEYVVQNDRVFAAAENNELLSGTQAENIHQIRYVGNDTLLYSTGDMEIYRVTDEASATPQLFDGGALYFDANETDIIIQENDTGNIYYASTEQSLAKVDEKPYIQATSQTQNFQATIASGSNKLIVHSDAWLNKIDSGAFISGTGIPANSYVINKRNNEVYINANATATGEQTLSIVSTSRKYYEPNDIIRDGARYGTRKYAGSVNYLAMPIPETGMGFFTCKEYTTGANSTDATKIATGIYNYASNTNYSLSILSGTSANFTASIIDGKMNIVFDKTGGGYADQDPEITIMRLS